jgi:hypothetical protein
MRSYAPPKLRKPQLWEFWDSHLGVLGQKVIWIWPPWKAAEYTIRGKMVAFPSSGRGESCVSKLPMVRLNTKSVPTMH